MRIPVLPVFPVPQREDRRKYGATLRTIQAQGAIVRDLEGFRGILRKRNRRDCLGVENSGDQSHCLEPVLSSSRLGQSNSFTRWRASFFSCVCFQTRVSNWQYLSGGGNLLFQYDRRTPGPPRHGQLARRRPPEEFAFGRHGQHGWCPGVLYVRAPSICKPAQCKPAHQLLRARSVWTSPHMC